MAILTHPIHGEKALKFCTTKTDKTKANITPMRLLVQHMTGIFDCVTVYVCTCALFVYIHTHACVCT